MKLRTEISENEEIIIRCRERNDKIRSLESAIEEALRGDNEITLTSGGTDYFIPKINILFFESYEGKVYAHTRDKVYICLAKKVSVFF